MAAAAGRAVGHSESLRGSGPWPRPPASGPDGAGGSSGGEWAGRGGAEGRGLSFINPYELGGGPDGCFCVRFAFDPVLGGFRRIWVLSALLSSSSGPASGLGFPVGADSTAEQPSQHSPEVCSILPEQHHGLRNAVCEPSRAHPVPCPSCAVP